MQSGYVYFATQKNIDYLMKSLTLNEVNYVFQSDEEESSLLFPDGENLRVSIQKDIAHPGVLDVSSMYIGQNGQLGRTIETCLKFAGCLQQGHIFSCAALWSCEDESTFESLRVMARHFDADLEISKLRACDEFGKENWAVTLNFPEKYRRRQKNDAAHETSLMALSLGMRTVGLFQLTGEH
ncbi:hypothetical protein EON80_07330 [bacterium]|nr:MAG: hypothetical protein EON80_07330 [bacterium]